MRWGRRSREARSRFVYFVTVIHRRSRPTGDETVALVSRPAVVWASPPALFLTGQSSFLLPRDSPPRRMPIKSIESVGLQPLRDFVGRVRQVPNLEPGRQSRPAIIPQGFADLFTSMAHNRSWLQRSNPTKITRKLITPPPLPHKIRFLHLEPLPGFP